MESNGKRYWRGIEELENDLEFVKNAEKEFSDAPTIVEDGSQPNRRDFLKLMGFSVAAVSVAACQAPVKKAIPYLLKPAELDPSIPNYYASTYFEDGDFASILVKTREGRPIKIEGNDLSSISGGKTSARAQASLLSLYDIERYKEFMKGKDAIAMDKADAEIKAKLAEAKSIRLVSSTIISPSTKAAIKAFLDRYKDADAKHVMYDAVSASGMLDANKESFGVAAIPSYDFSKAEVIVSINCDFLGTWISPVEFSRQFAQTRKVGKEKKTMSRFHAFESRLSMTGANADYRTAIKPSQEGALVASLYKKLTGSDTFKNDKINKALDRLVKDLKEAQGKALVVSGSNDADVQTVVNAINNELGSYGNTIDMTTPCYLRQGSDAEMDKFIEEAGSQDVVIFYGVNPCYNHPKADKLKSALSKVKTKITFSMRPNETASMCDYICPNHHYLESWGDAEPKKGQFSLVQPTITPIFKTRQAQESLLVWADAKTTNFYDFVRGYWAKNIYPAQKQYKTFDEFWANTLHDGVFAGNAVAKPAQAEEKKEAKQPEKEGKAGDKPADERPRVAVAGAFKGDVEAALADIAKEYKAESSDLELQVYEKVGIGSGMQANNPWLQEMPDPITRACWGNYVSISQPTAKAKNLSQGDVVKVTASGVSFELPVLVQPGQANDCIVVAIGYGRAVTGKIAQGIGANVFPLVNAKGYHSGVTLTKTDKYEEVAQTQTHHTIMGRDIIQEASLKEYKESATAGRNLITIHTDKGPKRPTDISLWKGHTYPNHSWSLMIDLNSCTGCGACVVACQIENNVPVVGKKEVLMRREMHWIRIDRYYSSDANKIASEQDKEGSYGEMEIASDNPDVTFMPLMCQHCNNAPCETVCPVLATTHSNEGLNQMAYNRCVGTRYCANNCPFKVRRFNWFHYAEDDRFTVVNPTQTNDLGRMVLNPDVTVRSRGVMEKCTMCVQRIQAGKLEAKKEKRRPTDGDIQTACSQVCPTGAIIFGDMLNENSEIGKIVAEEHDKRAYHLLEEINVKPQIAYLTKIRNTDEKKARFKAEAHGGGHGEHKEGKEHKEHKEEKGKEHKEEKHS